MKVGAIIKEAKVLHEKYDYREEVSMQIFTKGAEWLFKYHNIIFGENKTCPKRAYEIHGRLKYTLSVLAFIVVLVPWYFSIGYWVLIFAVFAFYWVEAHFIFLFPLAIDSKSNLWLKSIVATYRFGIIKSFYYTVRIAIYMLIGLFDFKKPFHQWRIGCLAVLILYHNEIRDRV